MDNLQSLNRLTQISSHFTAKQQPVDDVWAHLSLDDNLSQRAVVIRQNMRAVMESHREEILSYYDKSDFPFHIIPKLQSTGANGLQIKDFGGAGLTNIESGAIAYEMAKVDASVATFFLVHNSIGMSVVDQLGDEEQRARLLPDCLEFKKVTCFGLSEPLNGSDASGLQTFAKKVDGGFVLNGQKRWIGNATFSDYINVWARNEDEGGKIQCFVVTKGSKGLKTSKIENKYSMRIVQNADIEMKDVFVPFNNRLTHATDFQKGTAKILEHSRLGVAWMIVGLAAGAYEQSLKYCLKRKQFGKVIVKYQLIQEKLSRMLGLVESMLTYLTRLSVMTDQGKTTIGMISRAKSTCSRLTREVCQLAREACGGNGIILDNHVMKALMDVEAMHTYEGTYEINMLVSGRELTGGFAAFKSA